MTAEQVFAYACQKGYASKFTESGFMIVVPVWLTENPSAGMTDVDKFVKKFFSAYDNRPSQRISGKMTTVPDPLIDEIIEERIPAFSEKHIKLIRFGHRLSMGAENISGLILEEYIHSKVLKYGWATCWGSCIKAVDLCSATGSLIQIKNKDNTENSSSDKIRSGTSIKKWFRLSSKNGKTEWPALNYMLGIPAEDQLSEKGFVEFARQLVRNNPQCLFVDRFECAEIESYLGDL